MAWLDFASVHTDAVASFCTFVCLLLIIVIGGDGLGEGGDEGEGESLLQMSIITRGTHTLTHSTTLSRCVSVSSFGQVFLVSQTCFASPPCPPRSSSVSSSLSPLCLPPSHELFSW